ncbi:MAG: GIY-YIG nuclease family protein [Methanoregula sp.]|nr:GIY-YIG nuclease family protein [Methanoregula sp.]
MDKGIYCLVFQTTGCPIQVGALGKLTFRTGWYIYVGSALGSGGLQRPMRHILLARLRDKQPKWHVDYLLTSACFSLVYVVSAITADRLECRLARELNKGAIPKFGCSDCSCTSHLLFRQADPMQEILAVFRELRLDPVIKTIINSQV